MSAGTNKWLVPVAGDFDLASWVTGIARRIAPRDYHPELGDIERETRYALEQIEHRVAPANYSAARSRFLAKRTLIQNLVLSANLEDDGRAIALRHLQEFYDVLGTDL